MSDATTAPNSTTTNSATLTTMGTHRTFTRVLAGRSFYADPKVSQVGWLPTNATLSATSSAANAFIASVPQPLWLTNSDNPTSRVASDVRAFTQAAADDGSIPELVTYAIPGRDCGLYSAGGFSDGDRYKAWIDQVAAGIADRQAVVIVEPDALAKPPVFVNGKAYGDCPMTLAQTRERYRQLRYAIATLGALPHAQVYADAGSSRWWYANPYKGDYDDFRVRELAARLRLVGVDNARGFELNTSGTLTTESQATFAEKVVKALGGNVGYVIDTSRNGNGPTSDEQWCNPPGRALGALPTTTTDYPHADAYLWVKHPGESDGNCNRKEPYSGHWFQSYADALFTNSAYAPAAR